MWTVDDALAAIAARPETDLSTACAWACYEAMLAQQEAGGDSAERADMLCTFAEAKRTLLGDLLDVAELPST